MSSRLAICAFLIVAAFGLVYLVMDRIAKQLAKRFRAPKPSVRRSDDPLG
jgi:hypothetical protein